LTYFFLSTFPQSLIKELVDLGSHFIGFRDEAATLKGEALSLFVSYLFLSCFCTFSYFFLLEALRHAEERADNLESKLKASEEAKLKASKGSKLKADDLVAKLRASEEARKKAEKDASGVEDSAPKASSC
jgi:hypothetical protein